MKLLNIFLFVLLTNFNFNVQAAHKWGATGHRTIGAIADNYINKKTKRHLKKILKHQSIAMVSTYGDEIKSDPRYPGYDAWHYVNMPLDATYEASKKNPDGDLVTAIAHCKRIIQDPKSSDEDKAFHLKMLIHLIGDLHQPLHVGREEDRGGNDILVQWHFTDTNLHKVWDSQLLDTYKMSYTERADNADYLTKHQVRQYQQGSVVDWVQETQNLAKTVHASVEPGDNLSYDYSYKYMPVARKQLQVAGIRLAKVLNDLF